MQKIKLFHWSVLETRFIKKPCNLIGWKHFGPYLRTEFFDQIPVFGPFLVHFPNFRGKNVFSVKCGSVTLNFIAPCQNLEKTDDTIPRNRPDRRRDRQKDVGQTLLATTGGPIIRATKLFNDYNRYLTIYFQQELIFKPPLKLGFSCR